MSGLLFGRRIRVTIGRQVVIDLDPRESEAINELRNLHVEFSCSTHAKPEPLVCDITVHGLNRERRKQLTEQQDVARRTAWQKYQAVVVGDTLVEPDQVEAVSETLTSQGATIIVEAGYDNDFDVIHRGIILPDGLRHTRQQNGGWSTVIRSQDGRLPWANAFVSKEVAPGVSLVDYQKALAVSEQFLSGDIGAKEVQEQAPGLLEEKLDVFGYENGKVLHGQSRDQSQVLMDTLGLYPMLVDGKPYFLPLDAIRFTEAVVLQLPSEDEAVPAPGGLLSVDDLPRGYKKVRCLLNHRLSAGRQVQLKDEFGLPIGVGLFRVEHAQHAGGDNVANYNTDATLRPTAIAPENNG